MKKPVQPIREKELCRDFPIEGLVPGWFFRQREVSASCYVVAGRDIYGREVSIQSTNPDAALEECVQYARRISNPISTPIFLFCVTDTFDIADRGCVLIPGIPAPSESIPVVRKLDAILLRRPDGSECRTFMRELELIRRDKFYAEIPLLLPREFTKADVPIGTEVWLVPADTMNLNRTNANET